MCVHTRQEKTHAHTHVHAQHTSQCEISDGMFIKMADLLAGRQEGTVGSGTAPAIFSQFYLLFLFSVPSSPAAHYHRAADGFLWLDKNHAGEKDRSQIDNFWVVPSHSVFVVKLAGEGFFFFFTVLYSTSIHMGHILQVWNAAFMFGHDLTRICIYNWRIRILWLHIHTRMRRYAFVPIRFSNDFSNSILFWLVEEKKHT